jgi:3-hydroxyisobutyrate dehydrogenase-like beta-hydroxyacid dehydrogenase
VRALGGASRRLGADVALPATLEAALNAPLIGLILGSMQGALLCERFGFDVAAFSEILHSALRIVGIAGNEYLLETIANNRFEAPEAALKAYAAAYAGWARDARDRGISVEFLEFVDRVLARGVAAGYGDQELSAVMKLWRR